MEQDIKKRQDEAKKAWEKIQVYLDRADNPPGVVCGRRTDISTQSVEVAVVDRRWTLLPNCPWTNRDEAVLWYAWHRLITAISRWVANPRCIYGAAIEFAEQNPKFDIYFNGELL